MPPLTAFLHNMAAVVAVFVRYVKEKPERSDQRETTTLIAAKYMKTCNPNHFMEGNGRVHIYVVAGVSVCTVIALAVLSALHIFSIPSWLFLPVSIFTLLATSIMYAWLGDAAFLWNAQYLGYRLTGNQTLVYTGVYRYSKPAPRWMTYLYMSDRKATVMVNKTIEKHHRMTTSPTVTILMHHSLATSAVMVQSVNNARKAQPRVPANKAPLADYLSMMGSRGAISVEYALACQKYGMSPSRAGILHAGRVRQEDFEDLATIPKDLLISLYSIRAKHPPGALRDPFSVL